MIRSGSDQKARIRADPDLQPCSQFFPLFVGYDDEEDNTWEPQENLDCEDKIVEFERKRKLVRDS